MTVKERETFMKKLISRIGYHEIYDGARKKNNLIKIITLAELWKDMTGETETIKKICKANEFDLTILEDYGIV